MKTNAIYLQSGGRREMCGPNHFLRFFERNLWDITQNFTDN